MEKGMYKNTANEEKFQIPWSYADKGISPKSFNLYKGDDKDPIELQLGYQKKFHEGLKSILLNRENEYGDKINKIKEQVPLIPAENCFIIAEPYVNYFTGHNNKIIKGKDVLQRELNESLSRPHVVLLSNSKKVNSLDVIMLKHGAQEDLRFMYENVEFRVYADYNIGVYCGGNIDRYSKYFDKDILDPK